MQIPPPPNPNPITQVRERTVRKYTECKEQPFNFHETRSNIEKVRQEVEQKRNSELQFESSHRKPLPDFTKRNAGERAANGYRHNGYINY